jgi:hypothetical protein
VHVVVPAVDSIDVHSQLNRFVYDVGIEPIFDLRLDEVFTILGCPHKVVAESPEGHGVSPFAVECRRIDAIE